ncbi:uncharacterized protein LOC129296581 [Prosopis cineraria]|uniref:uncharacterized protein LOC129286030 n=1 Tax=Prosopis cineraria TaxID=364024 RepID=UPI00240F3C58|nr:uncharacterized protein LOC129286030 [Prosopis cineraria]XP_054791137.1 uncharacterized protein LOC129296581 [Prosopis cineraria]
MASTSGNSILVTFLVALTFSSMMMSSSVVAGRHLLQTTQPSIPNMPGIPSNLPKPTGLPPLPSIPITMPQPNNVPPLPTNIPNLPSMPTIPTVPQVSLPPLPSFFPNIPSIPTIPTTMPSIPFLSPPPSN